MEAARFLFDYNGLEHQGFQLEDHMANNKHYLKVFTFFLYQTQHLKELDSYSFRKICAEVNYMVKV